MLTLKNKVANNVAAVVLAGGKNSRMSGLNKAFIEINGTSIIQRTIKILHGLFEEIIIVTNSPEEFKLFKKEAMIITDIIKNVGPLGGVHAALSATFKRAVFFVACDMPFLHNAIIHKQLGYFAKINCDCLVPRIGFSIEPLHAVFKRSLKDNISSFLKNSADHSIKSFLATADVRYFDLDDKIYYRNTFRNLNNLQDLKKIGSHYGSKI